MCIRDRPNDVLDIKVHTQNLETAAPFNLLPSSQTLNISNPELLQLSGYLVDTDGTINFPVIGKWKVQGLHMSEAKAQLLELLTDYLKDPVINIRLLNFRITIDGEVLRPGSFTVYSERISIPEAIAMAGGMTPYATSCLLYTSPSPRDATLSRMPSSA